MRYSVGFTSLVDSQGTYEVGPEGLLLVEKYNEFPGGGGEEPPPATQVWLDYTTTSEGLIEERLRLNEAEYQSETANTGHWYGLKKVRESYTNFMNNTAGGVVPVSDNKLISYVPRIFKKDGNYNTPLVEGSSPNYTNNNLDETIQRRIVHSARYARAMKDHEGKIRVKNVLLTWASRPDIDFTNTNLFPITGSAVLTGYTGFWPIFFSIGALDECFLQSSYLEPGEQPVWTDAEKAKWNTYAEAAARYCFTTHRKKMIAAWPQRNTLLPEHYSSFGAQSGYYRLMIGPTSATDDSVYYSGMRYIGNKEASLLWLVNRIGIRLNIAEFREEAKRTFRESLTFGYSKHGFSNEFQRGAEFSTWSAEIGNAYHGTMNSVWVAIAEDSARVGDTFYYTYGTEAGRYDTANGVNTRATPGTPKTLLYILKQNIRLLNDSSFVWYCSRDEFASSRRGQLLYRVDGKYKDTVTDAFRSGHIGAACLCANKYYKDAAISTYLTSPPYSGDQAGGSGSWTKDQIGFGQSVSSYWQDGKKDAPWGVRNVNPYPGVGNTIGNLPSLT